MRVSDLTGAGGAALALLTAAVLATGCFSERVAGSDPPAFDESLCSGTQQPNVMRIRDFAFHAPDGTAELHVSAGTRVTWVNCEVDVSHTSTSDTGVWNSGLLAHGATFSRVFDQTGRFPYHCEPHPFMLGAVVVD